MPDYVDIAIPYKLKLQYQKTIHFLSQKLSFISALRRRHRLCVSQIAMERLLLIFMLQEWPAGHVNVGI